MGLDGRMVGMGDDGEVGRWGDAGRWISTGLEGQMIATTPAFRLADQWELSQIAGENLLRTILPNATL